MNEPSNDVTQPSEADQLWDRLHNWIGSVVPDRDGVHPDYIDDARHLGVLFLLTWLTSGRSASLVSLYDLSRKTPEEAFEYLTSGSDQEEFADGLLHHVALELPFVFPPRHFGIALWLLRTAVHQVLFGQSDPQDRGPVALQSNQVSLKFGGEVVTLAQIM